MSGHVVSDIRTQAEGERLYVRYNTDANIVKYSTCDIIKRNGMILGEKIERKV